MMILEGKIRQKRGTWKNDDTQWFFEALTEHGKDFSAIQIYMALRYDKKLPTPQEQVKNREQVRHYYYRTWHKISPCLTFPEYLDKQTQELYGLINFGELWKKLGSKSDSKIKHHLNELVNTGQTLVKFKGKNLKIKTPVCKALKKLHKLDDISSSHPNVNNLPKEIVVELHPATNDAWMRVHSLAQNPRLRVKVPLQKRLSELISYLDNRWSSVRIRELEYESHVGGVSSIERDPDKLYVLPHSSMTEDLSGIMIKRVPLNFNAQIDLSLSAYLKKFHQNSCKEIPEKKPPSSSSSSSSSSSKNKPTEFTAESSNTDNSISHSDHNDKSKNITDAFSSNESSPVKSSEDVSIYANDKSNLPPIAETVLSLTRLKGILDSASESGELSNGEGSISSREASNQSQKNDPNCKAKEKSQDSDKDTITSILPLLPPANVTIAEWLGASTSSENEQNYINGDKNPTHETSDVSEPSEASPEEKYQNVSHELELELLKKGWTSDTADLLIGELFLMFKNPPKIVLEYDWTKKESSESGLECKDEPQAHSVLDKLITASNIALMSMRNKQNGGDNLRLPPVKSKSYSRKNKRLKLGSPPPALHPHIIANNLAVSSITTPTSIPSTTSNTATIASLSPLSTSPNKEVILPNCKPLSSNLLSSVISGTILNGLNGAVFTQESVSGTDNQTDESTATIIPLDKSDPKNRFIIPTSPAPKTANKTNKIICNNIAIIQEAINQWNNKKLNTR
ncbi:cramped chromatin regulator isoform X2 [Brevipalpus obovatus]|uniref:cramped chromatin regulator isoform X2 n=1 Tax=Brevipalpus obovatus TaxID=246614 RepID=UPI003D9E1CB8